MEKYRPYKLNILIGVIFGGVGLAMLIAVVVILSSWSRFEKYGVPVQGVISDITVHHRKGKSGNRRIVHISYEYEGREYTDILSYYSATMHRGDPIQLLVDPDRPDIHQEEPTVICLIMSVFIISFGGVGFGFLIYEIRRYFYINNLIASDKYVYAEYEGEKPSGTKVNNVRYLSSQFVYRDGSGEEFRFSGEPHHPDEQLYRAGEPVLIYVDIVGAPKKYYVSKQKSKLTDGFSSSSDMD